MQFQKTSLVRLALVVSLGAMMGACGGGGGGGGSMAFWPAPSPSTTTPTEPAAPTDLIAPILPPSEPALCTS